MDLTSNPYFQALLVGIVVFILYMALDMLILGRGRQGAKLKAIEGLDTSNFGDAVSITPKVSMTAQGLQDVIRVLGVDVDARLEEFLVRCNRAGINLPDAPTYLLLYKYILGLTIAVVGGILVFSSIFMSSGGINFLNLLVGIILLVIGLFGSDLYLTNKSQKHAQTLLRSFPDTLDLLVICVESGLALDAALARICKELGKAHPAITEEMNKTRMELTLLNDRPQALINLAERTNLVPLRSLAAALIQTEKFGTSLTDTLRVLSEDYRLTRLMMAEQKAGRLPVLMTLPLILLLIPAFIIIILAPPFIRVADQGGIFGNIGE